MSNKDVESGSSGPAGCVSNSGSGDVSSEEEKEVLVFEHKKQVAWWLRHLRLCPTIYQGSETQRMSGCLFILGALDLLGALRDDGKIPFDERQGYIDWIYDQQVAADVGGGFAAGPYLPKAGNADQKTAVASTSRATEVSIDTYTAPTRGRLPHLAVTFEALLSLALLRDDFTRLNKDAILKFVGSLQLPDGSFHAIQNRTETDCRFVYCAIAICSLFKDFSTINIDSTIDYVLRCQSYEGGFGQEPMEEAHGGTTLCAVAVLSLCGRLHEADTESLYRWLAARMQGLGFNGRTEKKRDTCYSYWCGTSLAILGAHDVIEKRSDIAWLLKNQTPTGGISKSPSAFADVMHSYLGLATLSLHVYGGNDEPKTVMAENRELHIDAQAVPESVQLGIKEPFDMHFHASSSAIQWLKDHVR